MTSTPEQWLPVVGWETSHEVSDYGKVRSIDRWITRRGQTKAFLCRGKLKTLTKTDHGYYVVTMKAEGRKLIEYVHYLVLRAFVGPRPIGYDCLHGVNGTLDNHLTNLQWGTSSQNRLDRRRDGTDPMLNRTHCPRGHPLIEPNLIKAMLPNRSCLACDRARGIIRWRQPRNPNQTFNLKEYSDECYRGIMVSASAVNI